MKVNSRVEYYALVRERVMSEITVSTPKEWDKNTALAVLDAWIDALDRGYTLSIKQKGESNESNGNT